MPLRSIAIVVFTLCLAGCGQDRSVTRGALLYAQNCAICHGFDKRGGGGAGVVGLSKTPSDLTVLTLQAGGVFPTAEVLTILGDYATGTQVGRRMRPFIHLTSEDLTRVRTQEGRQRIPAPQAALLAYLKASQRP